LRTKASKTATFTAVVTEEKKVDLPQALAHSPSESTSAFHALLSRPTKPVETSVPVKAEGIAIGVLVKVSTDGSLIQVMIPSLGLGPLSAVSMVALGSQHIGQSLALGFEGANAHRPVVLGLMMQESMPINDSSESSAEAGHQAVRVMQEGHRVVIEAHTELELRCGEAVILLSEDGNIQIRGAYVTTHASASNRIRGGSVQIN
jgi:hypothetical protein